jgi:hypothetical protein
MKVFLPYRGEFGHKIMWHVPTVYHCKGEKVVCCEQGEEALFPGATEYVLVERNADANRREKMNSDEELHQRLTRELSSEYTAAEFVRPQRGTLEFFVPEPRVRYGITCDVVICPRKRRYGSVRNWKLWPQLYEALASTHRVFAAGAPDSSEEVGPHKAWAYERFLDATLEAMLAAKVVIATDTGLAFLALLCGKPICLISHSSGQASPSSPPIRLERYRRSNHKGVTIDVACDAWTSIEPVVRIVQQKYKS